MFLVGGVKTLLAADRLVFLDFVSAPTSQPCLTLVSSHVDAISPNSTSRHLRRFFSLTATAFTPLVFPDHVCKVEMVVSFWSCFTHRTILWLYKLYQMSLLLIAWHK